MKASLIQIGLVALSLFIISERILRFLRREISQSIFKLFSFLIIWILILLISLFPQLAYYLSRRFGFGETLGPLIFAAFIVVFLLIFRLLNIIEDIERKITRIVREQALKDLSDKKKK